MSKSKMYLLAFLLGSLISPTVFAAEGSTKFKNVRVTGTLTVDGATTLTGATTQTGVTTQSAGFVPYSRTLAQINALTASTTGQFVFCSDCTRSAMCVSTGSVTAGAWTITVSTDVIPSYKTIHCQ